MGSIRSLLLIRDLGLVVLGAASLLVYALLLTHLTWLDSATYLPMGGVLGQLQPPAWLADPGPRPELTADSTVQQHAGAATDFLLGVTALFALYVLAIRLARGRLTWLGAVAVLGTGLLAQAAAVLSPFALSGDVYSYLIYGRMWGVYGGNPYLDVPAQYPGDPFFEHIFWKYVPSFYGPLWTVVSGGLARFAGHDIALALLLFRGLAAASALLSALVTMLVLQRAEPRRALVGATLVAWCPFVIIETGLGAHNDVLMGALLVLALALAYARWGASAVGCVVLAGLVKVTALAFLPLLGIYLLRTAPSWLSRVLVAMRSAVVAAVVAAAVLAPVWAGEAMIGVVTLGSGADRYVNSLAEPALGELRVRLGASREDLEVPLQFSGWWVANHTPTSLYVGREGTETVQLLPAWTELLVVGPERAHRLRVFDPDTRRIGYVDSTMLGPIDQPAELADDEETQARLRGPLGSWELAEANQQVRQVGWAAFLVAMLLALAFGTGSFARLAAGWAGVCLVLNSVTLTWFWPWYVLWGLLPAALAPRSRFTRATVFLAYGVSLAYSLMGFQDTNFWYLHNYRALPMFGVPLVLMLSDELFRFLAWVLLWLGRGTRWIGQRAARVTSRARPTTSEASP